MLQLPFIMQENILFTRKEVDIMSTIKPIQATPELSGRDATVLLEQVSSMPSAKAIQKNKMLCNILDKIRKV